MGRLALFDVHDAERFVAAIAAKSNLRLSHHDAEDLRQHLLVECWKLSTVEPQPWRSSFSGWVTPILRRKVVDWHRQRFGRTRWQFSGGRVHERQLPQFVSFDGPNVDQLGAAVGRSGVDDGALGVAAELRGLEARARRPRGRNLPLGYGPA
jgi:DNA-directed RNA polymerase specialized sigma24 family protein